MYRKERCKSDLSPCNDDEADARLILYAADAAKCSFKKVMLQTVDSDVEALAIAKFNNLASSEI